MGLKVLGSGWVAATLRDALAKAGLGEEIAGPEAIACALGDLPRALALRELAKASGPIIVWTDDAAAAIEAGADDAAATPEEVARRLGARLRAPAPGWRASGAAAAPNAGQPAAPQSAEPAQSLALRREKPLLLVVEDDPDAREILGELLQDRYEVTSAGDGETAIEMANRLAPDLVLLDLFLPGLDGFATLSRLRRDKRTADLPVIFLSAQGDADTKSQGLSLGAQDYLAKPFSAQELIARVERTLHQTAQREHFRALAETDALTGLPNFRSFRARLEEEVRRAERYKGALACAMMDLDGLKQINDALGHGAGNRAIQAFGDAIRMELRETDFAARYGGDEFVVLFPQTTAAQTQLFAERLRRRLQRASVETGIPVRTSIGVASLDGGSAKLEPAEAADDLLKRADEALYSAKRSGRDRVELGQEAH